MKYSIFGLAVILFLSGCSANVYLESGYDRVASARTRTLKLRWSTWYSVHFINLSRTLPDDGKVRMTVFANTLDKERFRLTAKHSLEIQTEKGSFWVNRDPTEEGRFDGLGYITPMESIDLSTAQAIAQSSRINIFINQVGSSDVLSFGPDHLAALREFVK
jgi:hypothetical protein